MSIVTEDYWQGSLHQDPKGKAVDVILELTDSHGFYQYVLEQFRR